MVDPIANEAKNTAATQNTDIPLVTDTDTSPEANPETSRSNPVSTDKYSPSTQQLKDVLRASVEVAKAGADEKPPIEPPVRLKKFVAFAKLNNRAFSQIREVLDTDEDFRARVAEEADLDRLSPISKLWLTKPDGWEDECRQLAASQAQDSAQAEAAQSQAAHEQKLARQQAVKERVERQRDKAMQERDDYLIKELQARNEASQAVEEAAKLADELKVALQAQQDMQAKLERSQRSAERNAEKLKKAKDEVKHLNKELRDVRLAHKETQASLEAQLEAVELQLAQAREAGFKPPPPPEPAELPDEPSERIPVQLPKGLLADTAAGLEYLLHTPHLVMLVDGYNVTYKAKELEGLTASEQRQRFCDKLDELSARFSQVEIVVWFDGQETDYDYISTTTRSLGVTVRFSTPDVEADDAIIHGCAAYPLSRPLAVVSHDNRVREGARAHGANVVQPSKLLMLIGYEAVSQSEAYGF
ncbi:MAG: NYN domain-containing protein [bacterium]|nr:NYN domain-containing protein [bacterium]